MALSNDERIAQQADEKVQSIPIQKIKPNPYQPRKTFDEAKLNDLADSIRQHGILQPIVLSESVQGYYIVVGERRYRASQLAGLTEMPAIVKALTETDMMELAIIENLQREDLNAMEEAESYQKLMDDLHITQQDVAKRLSKSRPYVANMLRLLNLPKSVADMVRTGEISGGHGRTLLAVKDAQAMKRLANRVSKEHWSVRYLESYLADNEPKKQTSQKATKQAKPRFIQKQERQLKEQYGTDVTISTRKQKGQITFDFTSEEEFKRLIRQLNRER
ncbi:ParB/RepB/Spo0J family partition protein [Staphylococcus argensis]|uniref:Chromosome partitioning protein ParB n=1 Tax=Staphylococcus argensis TaxID=1607738 RepID=A0A2K4FBC0_9STAP|nr:ParB/RepB/Spo0J family partition protein [Staphylococcus argensis]MCY6991776.1 ParB/RepB/Spo0J family partition protein [Staphylococcus argensis]POA08577.1 chromosome partitioning protein ParB [Staphylococcus argensis]